MHARFRLRPSPSMVVALLALLAALVGSGVAAVGALAPANSVGSAAVIDGSLQKKDLKPGVIPTPAAPVPPTEGVSVAVAGPVKLGPDRTEVASLPIAKPGSYVIWAKALMRTTAADGSVRCDLVDGPVSNEVWDPTGLGPTTVSTLVVRELTEPGVVHFRCLATDTSTSATQIAVVAVRLAKLTRASG